MKASRSNVRCAVLARYCCQTWLAISRTEELVFRVAGPEERVEVVVGTGAEAVEAACRLAGIVVELNGD
jgi:4-aminobutyrate aminotransferase-like enzyme